jgi:hypothetical protein
MMDQLTAMMLLLAPCFFADLSVLFSSKLIPGTHMAVSF